jgi:hypothetical protein
VDSFAVVKYHIISQMGIKGFGVAKLVLVRVDELLLDASVELLYHSVYPATTRVDKHPTW